MCRCMPRSAGPCCHESVSGRHFWVFFGFPKLRVAGSSPVSRSKILARLRCYAPGPFLISWAGGPEWAGCSIPCLRASQEAGIGLLQLNPMRVPAERGLRARMAQDTLNPHDRAAVLERPARDRVAAAVTPEATAMRPQRRPIRKAARTPSWPGRTPPRTC